MFLRAVDDTTEQPVADALLLRYSAAGEIVGRTDARGFARVALGRNDSVVVASPAHFLRSLQVPADTTRSKPAVVRLTRDRLSSAITLRFELPGGRLATAVRVRFTPTHGARTVTPIDWKTIPPATVMAWEDHRAVAATMAIAELPVQARARRSDHVRSLDGEIRVRFAEAGFFRCEALGDEGHVGSLTFEAGAHADRILAIRLQPGRTLAGIVRANDGQPVADAMVEADGSAFVEATRTGSDGRFQLAAVGEEPVKVKVGHREFAPFVQELSANGGVTVLALARLPIAEIRGRVRRALDRQPVAGALVSMPDTLGAPVAARTDDRGAFVLRVPRNAKARLDIRAEGMIDYAELVDPGAAELDFELWPGSTDIRVQAKLTALVCGRVIDSNGAPIARAKVRLTPGRKPSAKRSDGRSVLTGGAIVMPLTALTGADGAFALESQVDGPGLVTVTEPAAGVPAPVRVELVLGNVQRDLELRLGAH
jgi:hypothetical protein